MSNQNQMLRQVQALQRKLAKRVDALWVLNDNALLTPEHIRDGWLPYLDEWAEWVMKGLPRTEENGFQHIVFNSENPQQLWDDTLMMSVLPPTSAWSGCASRNASCRSGSTPTARSPAS